MPLEVFECGLFISSLAVSIIGRDAKCRLLLSSLPTFSTRLGLQATWHGNGQTVPLSLSFFGDLIRGKAPHVAVDLFGSNEEATALPDGR